ncbi:MAG: hypothetical protein L0Z70_17190 [Chloroflexi bacterium]|nr:hypothetical protein [Chloroflexota bacterium]
MTTATQPEPEKSEQPGRYVRAKHRHRISLRRRLRRFWKGLSRKQQERISHLFLGLLMSALAVLAAVAIVLITS